jgi:hypothetical protein
MRFFFISVIVIIGSSIVQGQPKLRQSIGVNSLPQDADSICQLGMYSPDPTNAGLKVGDTAYDFTLYDASGNPTTLSAILSLGKPVLLIDGSYTCGIFRNSIPAINDVASTFGQYVTTLLIYTAEAHPTIDPSPYPNPQDWIADSLNRQEHVLYRQPKTYGERKSIASDLISAHWINAPILFDAPCNQWLLMYGPAANIAYLIDEQGIIRFKEPWFNAGRQPTANDIQELLSNDYQSNKSDTGVISFQYLTQDTVYSTTNKTVTLGGKLINSTGADAIVQIERHNEKMPKDWQTAICTDICLSANIDTTFVQIPAHSTQDMTIYFYVGATSGTGDVLVHFGNENILSNSYEITLTCVANAVQSVSIQQNVSTPQIFIVPNPVFEKWSVKGATNYSAIRICDILGRIVYSATAANEYTSQVLAQGVYRVQLLSATNEVVAETTLIKR